MPGKDPEQARNKLEALVKALVDAAIAGNPRAQSLVVGALARLGNPENSEAPPTLTPDDKEILEAYVGGELKRRAEVATPSASDHHEDRRLDNDDQPSNKGHE